MALTYTYKEIEAIRSNGFMFTLPQDTIDIISSLAEEVGAPTYIRTPNFKKREKKRRKNNVQEVSNDDWEAIRQYQATSFKSKEGVDKCIEDIRLSLNKLTDTTYNTQKELIINNLQMLINMETAEDDLTKVCNSIFTTASSNKFYSTVYAKLYNELINEFSVIKTLFNKSFKEFIAVFNTIKYVSPEDDYDLFCSINKENENRQALSLFFTNLMKNDVITVDDMIDIVKQLQDQIDDLSDQSNTENEIAELTENLYIITVNGFELLEKHDEWENIQNKINNISELNIGDKKSINNKIIFKHLDMIEEFI